MLGQWSMKGALLWSRCAYTVFTSAFLRLLINTTGSIGTCAPKPHRATAQNKRDTSLQKCVKRCSFEARAKRMPSYPRAKAHALHFLILPVHLFFLTHSNTTVPIRLHSCRERNKVTSSTGTHTYISIQGKRLQLHLVVFLLPRFLWNLGFRSHLKWNNFFFFFSQIWERNRQWRQRSKFQPHRSCPCKAVCGL